MTKLFIIIFALFLTNVVSAQENTPQTEGSKKDKKAEKEATKMKQFEEIYAMLNEKRYVLEADYLVGDNLQKVSVSAVLNFIMVDSNMAVIQVGQNVGVGSNGVGGQTAKGNITSYQVDKNEKKKSFNVRMSINTTIGFFSVSMFIPAGSNTTATVTPIRLDMLGKLVPMDKSIVHEGWSL